MAGAITIFCFATGVESVPEINLYGQTVGDVVPDWKGAAVLPREELVGQYCRLVPLDADSHAADLFDAYAQAPDDRDWT